jgi:uridine kinase
MDVTSAAKLILEKIHGWESDREKLVVAMDGYSGIGKTTLLKKMVELDNSFEPLFMDDVVTTANKKEELLPPIETGSMTLNLLWSPPDGIETMRREILNFTQENYSKRTLVVEGIFLFHPDLLNDLWDKRIYLDANQIKADERRVKRERERWGEKYFPENHPDSYVGLFKIAHKRYEELCQPKEMAELIVFLD